MFVKYSEVLFKRYNGRVKYWMTFNEINSMVYHHFVSVGIIEEGNGNLSSDVFQSIHNQFVASALATKKCKEINEKNLMGCMISYQLRSPRTCDLDDIFKTLENNRDIDFFLNVHTKGRYPFYTKRMFKEANVRINIEDGDLKTLEEDCVDYIGVSYYMSTTISANPQKYYTTEANVIKYGLKNPFEQIREAIDKGVDLIGYTSWGSR